MRSWHVCKAKSPGYDRTGATLWDSRWTSPGQPGVDLLEDARVSPGAGRILPITDGRCARVRGRRKHALLIPAGATLTFVPHGRGFRLR